MAIIRNALQHELIKCIFGNLGLVPGSNWGISGLSLPEFITGHNVPVLWGDETVPAQFPIHAAFYPEAFNRLTLAAVRIVDKNNVNGPYEEFGLVFEVSGDPPIGIRASFEDFEDMRFLVYKNKSWSNISTYAKLIQCAGFESLASNGFNLDVVKFDINPFVNMLKELMEL